MIDHIKILSEDYIDNETRYMNDNILYLKNIILSILKYYKIDIDKCDININYFSPLLYQPNITNIIDNIDSINDNIKVNITIVVNYNIINFDSLKETLNSEDLLDYNGIINLKKIINDDLNKIGLYLNLSLIHKHRKSILNINCDYTPQRYEKLVYILTNKYRKDLLTKLKKELI